MKSRLIIIFFNLVLTNYCFAQIGIGTNTPNAILDVTSTNDGILIPRVALSSTTLASPLTTPTISELVYNTATINDVIPGFYFWSGTNWERIFTGSANGWSLNGNTGTNASTNYLGTSSTCQIYFKVNNTNAMYLASGNVGTNGPSSVSGLEVNSGLGNIKGTRFIGYGSGAINTNSSVGYSSLLANTSGNNNTANGYLSQTLNTTGASNSTFGAYSLQANTIGNSNTAIGDLTLRNNTTGSFNSAFGSSSLAALTTGQNNTAIGFNTNANTTTGSNNSSLGSSVQVANITGNNTTAVGTNSLSANNASNNTALGFNSLTANTTGINNTAIGYNSQNSSTTSNNNTSFGQSTLGANLTGNSNTSFGYGALGSTRGNLSTAVGALSGGSLTTTSNNTLLGYSSGSTFTSANNNICLGYQSGSSITTGNNNTIIGSVGTISPTTNGNVVIGDAYGNTRITVDASGNTGIGTTTPTAKLDVATGITTTQTVVNATGSINDFLQYNVQNTSTGTQAQSGYAATADNGTSTSGFAWMGINNSTFNYPTTYNIGGANDVTYVASGQDMYIANANNSKSIIFSTGKATTPFFNERMRITNTGNVGIGTSTPNYALSFGNSLANTKLAIWENGAGISFGIGVQNNVFRFNVYQTNDRFGFFSAEAGTEIFTIRQNGLVGIGTTNPIAKLDLTGVKSSGAAAGNGTSNDAATQALIAAGFNGSSRANDWPSTWGGGLSVYDIIGSSTFFGSYIIRSDKNLKKDINSIDESIVAKFKKLRPVTYFLKKEFPEAKGLQYGFIAQEVGQIFPSMVTESTDPDGTIGMNYLALIAPTIYVVQKDLKDTENLSSLVNSKLSATENLEKNIKNLSEELNQFKNKISNK